MSDALRTWQRSKKPSVFSRLVRGVRKPEPLRERISYTIYKLKVQNQRLNQAYQRMQNHYNNLFRKVTNAVMAKDSTRAHIYANESAEVRKMCETIMRSQFAIEQVSLRLETVGEFGDIAVEMAPIAKVISSIRGPLTGVVPEVSYTLGEIGGTLNDLVMEAGGATSVPWNVSYSGAEAEKILTEANAIAEQKMKDKFPTLPDAGLPSFEKSS